MMRRVDRGSLAAIGFVAALAIASYLFQDAFMNSLRTVLQEGIVKAALLIVVTIVVVSHSLKIKPVNDTSSVMIRSGLAPLDLFLTLGTYSAVTTTACSLLEGAYVQQFFGVKYFVRFDALDVYVLLGVAALLLWYVAFHMYKMFLELIFRTESVSTSNSEVHNNSMQPTADASAD